MPVSAFNRPGQASGAGEPDVNLLRVFAGEVLACFAEKNVMMGLTRVKTVSGGAVSWQFPVLGIAGTSYHTAGENILLDADAGASTDLKTIKAAARTIFADNALISSFFLDNLDAMLTHWDARSEYAREIGAAIARTVDKNLMRLIFKAAKASATIAGGYGPGLGTNGGSTVVDADGDTNAASFVDALFSAKLALDQKHVPTEGRYMLISPAQMKLLFASGGAVTAAQWVSADYNGAPNGNFGDGKIPRLAGFTLIETNHLEVTAATTFGDTYNQYSTSSTNDYRYTTGAGETILGLGFQSGAVGTVKLEDLSVETERLIEYQGDLTVARMVLGHGILRPECAVSIAKA